MALTLNGSTGIVVADGATIGSTSDTDAITVPANGRITFNQAILAQAGIQPNANAYAAAEVLNDYEEGTFSPAFNSTGGGESFTYSAQEGFYVKIGAYVWCSMNVSWSGRSCGSGQLRLGNLPFAPAGSNRRAVMGMPYSSCWTGLSTGWNIQPHSNMVSASAGTYYWRTASTGNIADYLNLSDLATSGTLQTVLGYESSA